MKITKKEHVTDLFDRLHDNYSKCRSQWTYDDNLYYFDHYAEWDEPNPGEERIMLNTPTNVVDLAHAILSMHPPKPTARPINSSRRSDAKATKIEKFTNGLVYVNDLRHQRNQISQFLFDLALYGRGALFSGWNPDLEGDGDEYREIPIELKYVNHKGVYCLHGGLRKDIAQMYVVWRTAEDLEAEWGKRIYVMEDGERERAEATEQVRYHDLWWYDVVKGERRVYHCVMAGDTWLKKPTQMKYYTDLPYTEVAARDTTSEEIHNKFLGVLYPLREAVSIMERLLNQGMNIVQDFADPAIVADESIQVQKGAGSVTYANLKEGQAISDVYKTMPPSDAAGGLYRFMTLFNSQISQGSFSSYTYSNVDPESGPVAQAMLASDRVRMNVIKRNAELGISIAIQKALQCAHEFAMADNGKRLNVFSEAERSAISLNPDDLRGWLVTVSLSDELPTDIARNYAVATNAVQGGLPISKYTLMQNFLGIDQPEDEIDRIMTEKIAEMPEVQQMALRLALARYNRELYEALFAPEADMVGRGGGEETLPPTTAVSPQGMGRPMPPEGAPEVMGGATMGGVMRGAPGPAPA